MTHYPLMAMRSKRPRTERGVYFTAAEWWKIQKILRGIKELCDETQSRTRRKVR